MPEWLIGADCKSAVRNGYVGSNPTPSTILVVLKLVDKAFKMLYNLQSQNLITNDFAHIAQLVEHVLGKNGVTSSNLVVG